MFAYRKFSEGGGGDVRGGRVCWGEGGGGEAMLLINILMGTLSKKQSKFPRYNAKCRERKQDTTRNIPQSISFSPLHFAIHLGKLISFGTVHVQGQAGDGSV